MIACCHALWSYLIASIPKIPLYALKLNLNIFKGFACNKTTISKTCIVSTHWKWRVYYSPNTSLIHRVSNVDLITKCCQLIVCSSVSWCDIREHALPWRGWCTRQLCTHTPSSYNALLFCFWLLAFCVLLFCFLLLVIRQTNETIARGHIWTQVFFFSVLIYFSAPPTKERKRKRRLYVNVFQIRYTLLSQETDEDEAEAEAAAAAVDAEE